MKSDIKEYFLNFWDENTTDLEDIDVFFETEMLVKFMIKKYINHESDKVMN